MIEIRVSLNPAARGGITEVTPETIKIIVVQTLIFKAGFLQKVGESNYFRL